MKYEIDSLIFETKTEDTLKSESFSKITGDDVCEYRLKIEFCEPTVPSKFSITWQEKQIDMLGFWSPKSSLSHNIVPDWAMCKCESRTASGMPLACIYNKQGLNRISVALSDSANSSVISAGVIEETGSIKLCVELLAELCPKMTSYEVTIRVDKRPITLSDAIRATRAWWSELGHKCAYVPNEARLPMYSTWYSFHQNTIPDEIIAECKIAKALGMDTVIVDDGWQTEDGNRGYAFCGDWKISKKKIPDMKAFVDEIHALGMKFMIWFSVPFVGFESKNYESFKGMYLNTRHGVRASVLDPRFKEVRDFLVDTYCNYVTEYGWDGLKLDFIDSFHLSEESSTEFDKMDTVSVEEAVEKLLSEVSDRLKSINPKFLIEFRQSYVGPIVGKYGNIFRVADCPNDAIINRVHSLDLRLSSGDIAVHSDMIMWNSDESNEAVWYQLLAVMFCVPQISVRFDNISDDHKRILSSFLSFWREHRATLLDGDLSVFDTEANYSMAKSEKDGECVCVLYQSVVAKVDCDTSYIFNSTGSNSVYLELDRACKGELFNIFGEKYAELSLDKGICKVELKNCEMIKIS